MKIALISDLHGNFFYLESVSAKLAEHKPDILFCLGDLVGYYDQPGRVIDWCIANNVKCVKGNHDKMLLGELQADASKARFYRTEIQRRQLSADHLDFLSQLPDSLDVLLSGKRFFITHSKPGDCVGYAYDVNDLPREFLRDYNYYCYGHTHIPMVRYHYGTVVVNPGSIGQPRDFSKQPSYAIIDLNNDSVSIYKLNVDYKSYCESLLTKHFEPEMVDILQRATK